jgi:hypothetical protein
MRPVTSLFAALVLVAVVGGIAHAQQGSTAIRGRVTDESQSILPGVTVLVTHAESGTVRETLTGSDGTFLVAGIVPGPYRVAASLAGFSRLTQEGLTVRVGTTLQVDLTLKVGALEENLTVTAVAPQVDLTSAQVGANVSTSEIANLPNGNGNFTGLIAILPGVVYNRASDGQSDNVTINGQPGTGVVYQLDGGSNNDDLRGGSAGAQTRPALESIQEFQVVTNQFDAEYGAALSGVINAVTKQGSNRYHGSVVGYLTNAAMTSRDILAEQANREKPDTRNRRYGATLGGPIVRDKLHYFVSYEKQDRDEGRSYSYLTRPELSFSTVQVTRMQNLLGRVDHQINSDNQYSVRFLWDHQPTMNQPLGNATIDTLSQDKDNDYTLVGSYNRVFGSTKLYSVRAALVHEKPVRGQQLYQETGDWTLAPPSLVFQNVTTQADIERADYRLMDSYQLDNTFSWFISGARGSHDLKFGQQYTYGEHFEEFQRFMNGAFRFHSDAPFNATDPSTYPERLEVRVPGKGEWLSRTHSLGLFIQDKWQVTTALTLNLGLRYDVHWSPLRWDGNPFFSDPAAYPLDTNNIAPRIGFAYNIGNRSVIRGGYGLFFEKQYVDRFNIYQQNPVFSASFNALFPAVQADPGPSDGRFPTDPLLVNGPVLNRDLINQLYPPGTTVRNTGDVWLDTPDRILPYANQASIGYERMLGAQVSLSADYTHMANRQLPIRYNLNPALRINTTRTGRIERTDIRGVADQMNLTPFTSNVYIREYIGETDYDGLSVQVEKRTSNNWGGRVSYTIGYGRGNTDGGPTSVNNFQLLAERNLELNQGPTSSDRRHVFNISGQLEVPWVQGLIASAVFRAASGTPFTIHDSRTDPNRNGVLVDPIAPGTYNGNGINAITVENKGGRNGAYGPGEMNLDMRLGYRVRGLGQGRTLDLFLEAFNVTNAPNFSNPTGDMRSAQFLVPESLRGGGFPRQLQIGSRFGF